ncbi:MAG: ATP-dependent RecD-like DNA helicase [Clostridia bacterium]|nr:ATP-dependent RecD-like DNA helicase [Clostridia bacterium]
MQLRCVVERITYRNDENGFCILKGRVKNQEELVSFVGTFPAVPAGTILTCEGDWKIDARYGKQFVVVSYRESLPATVYGIEKYLGSGLISGIGPKNARKIVQTFGEDTLRVLDETPQRLIEVPGLGKKRVERIVLSWAAQKDIKEIMVFLQSHDVSTAHAARIYKQYAGDSLRVLRETPYRLADDIWGIGFVTADRIALKLGMKEDSYDRLRSGLLFALSQFGNEGHCYALRSQLTAHAAKLLGVSPESLTMTLDSMISEKDLLTEEVIVEDSNTGIPEQATALFLPALFYAELGVARRLIRLLAARSQKSLRADDKVIARLMDKTGLMLDEKQQLAVQMALTQKVMVLTGGPGTGKTTTLRAILTAFQLYGLSVSLAAPTGRAAKRMTEACSQTGLTLESKTIHRLLQFQPPQGYEMNEQHPLTGDVLIVDECSMIDLTLFYSLLKAIPDAMRLILIGDVDQLPSIGAGNVLSDLLESRVIPAVRLTQIHRQASGSRIITNAHRVNLGIYPDFTRGSDCDCFFLEAENNPSIVSTVLSLVSQRLPKAYSLHPTLDIQVLAPMQRGETGCVALNNALQSVLNPHGDSLNHGGILFRIGDKVMQIRNNYDKEVFNGDIGFVRAITDEKEMDVDFDGRLVRYESMELDELMLAYAVTVHKAQGSEFPVVVLPLSMSAYPMLQRNLIYTGMTRAKRLLVLVGDSRALSLAVNRADGLHRQTWLAPRLHLLAENQGLGGI